MRFWRRIVRRAASLWGAAKPSTDERRDLVRVPSFNQLSRLDEFEDRTPPHSVIEVPYHAGIAEVLPLSLERGYSRQQRRYFRLSVLIVDYLLEREWYWLLTGQHRTPAPYRRHYEEAVEPIAGLLRDDRDASQDNSSQTRGSLIAHWTM